MSLSVIGFGKERNQTKLIMSSTIISYNLHGFNQGKHLLNYYCTRGTDDILFLQEHWLGPDSLNIIDSVCPGYYAFSVSSFETSVSSGLLRGRPYGGLAILVKNNYRSSCKLIRKHERFIAILFNDLLLINVYFPSPSRVDCKEETIELIAQIEELMIDTPLVSDVIIGGDFNCNLDVNNWSSNTISDLMKNFNLKSCSSVVPSVNNLDYTYFHETLGQFSYLDYFLVSPAIANLVQKHEICSDEPNLSDHMPIRIYIDEMFITSRAAVNSYSAPKHCCVNDWKKADLLTYYELTRRGLQPLLTNVMDKDIVFVSPTENNLKLIENPSSIRKIINSTYSQIVEILTDTARQSVPIIKVDINKFWWDQELKELKEKCIISYNLWIAAGRQRCGHLYDLK
jgi:exonuclease III